MENDKSTIINLALPQGTQLKGRKTYTIEKVLGAGGFGLTYQASAITMDGNIRRKNLYAIKEHFMKGCYRAADATTILYPVTLKNDVEQSRMDFENEADRLIGLGDLSQNIVKVNEKLKANGTFYYVMEYLDGGSLEKLVARKGALSEAVALSLIIPIAHVVNLLHSGEKRLLHLDIKPDNIVLKTDEINKNIYPVLIDFGTAKHFDKKGKPTTLLTAKGATEGFAPIEQYAEINEFDARLDVYALGATLFYLLTGKVPIKAWDITSNYISLKLPSGVSERTKMAIINAMQKDKHERTPSVQAFLNEIEKIYTLPLFHELQSTHARYRIVEILKEDNYSITYRAILSNSISGHSASQAGSGNETVVSNHYELHEYYEQSRCVRNENGTVTISDSSSDISNRYNYFIRESESFGLMEEKVIENENGTIEKERFKANGTIYYAIKQGKKKIDTDIHIDGKISKKIIKEVASYIMYVLIIVAVLLIYNAVTKPSKESNTEPNKEDTSIQNKITEPDAVVAPVVHNEPQQTEQTEQTKPQKDKSEVSAEPIKVETDAELFKKAQRNEDWSTIEQLANKGYQKAYIPLANHYLQSSSTHSLADKWAQRAKNYDITGANAIIEKLKLYGYYD